MNRHLALIAAAAAALALGAGTGLPANAVGTEDAATGQVQTMTLVAEASAKGAAAASLTPTSAAQARPALAIGASSPAVIYLQRKLGVQPVSGYFGPLTQAAVKSFQTSHKLARTGKMDSRTWAALLASKSAGTKATKAAAAASKAAARAEAARKVAAAKKAAAVKAAKKAAARKAAAKAARKAAAAKKAAARKAAAAKRAAARAAKALTPEQAAAQRPEIEFGDGPGNPAVIFVQRYLKVVPQSGYFGAMTREAVLAYQRGLGITASGVVGPNTWQAIFDGKVVDTTVAADAGATDPEAPTVSADATSAAPPAPTTPTPGTIPTPTYTLPANPTAADKALVFALAQVGKPYVLGGNGPEVFDCSGLVQQAYLTAGVTLPRLASQQQFSGTEVTLENLLPGDLLYYQDGSSPRRGHISMYAGNGLVVEAANPRRGVRMRTLNESWYAERFVRATHIAG